MIPRQPAAPDATWRRTRREALREMFKVAPSQRLEIFPILGRDGAQALQTRFRTGGWFHLSVATLTESQDSAPGVLYAPTEEPNRAIALVSFSRVSSVERARLRQVYSLSHIGDLGDDDPGGIPTPTPPLAPWLKEIGKPRKAKRSDVAVFGLDRLPDWMMQSRGPAVRDVVTEARQIAGAGGEKILRRLRAGD